MITQENISVRKDQKAWRLFTMAFVFSWGKNPALMFEVFQNKRKKIYLLALTFYSFGELHRGKKNPDHCDWL